jgi:integrase/recombinase XerD
MGHLVPVQAGAVRPVGPTIGQLAEDWLTEYRGHTRRAYRADLEAFLEWCAEHRVDPANLRRADVNRWRNSLLERDGLSERSADRRLSSCKSFYRYLAEEELIDGGGPFQHLRKLHRDGGDSATPWLTRDELVRFLDAARASHPRDFILAGLLGLNGLRISEAIAAKAEHLGESAGHRILRIPRRKGGKSGVVAVAPQMADAIDDFFDGRTEGPLVVRVHRSGAVVQPVRGISRESAHRRIKRLAELAGVNPEISPHSLRHSFITLALDSGADLHRVSAAAGHSRVETTMGYDHGRWNLDKAPTYDISDAILGG